MFNSPLKNAMANQTGNEWVWRGAVLTCWLVKSNEQSCDLMICFSAFFLHSNQYWTSICSARRRLGITLQRPAGGEAERTVRTRIAWMVWWGNQRRDWQGRDLCVSTSVRACLLSVQYLPILLYYRKGQRGSKAAESLTWVRPSGYTANKFHLQWY